MIDGYGRNIDYIRISLTDCCNLRCVYCMPENGIEPVEHSEILTYDEILHLAEVFESLGFKKIKLTGGEPLVRKHAAWLAGQLKQIPGIEQVTLTTNGILLADANGRKPIGHQFTEGVGEHREEKIMSQIGG